MQRGADLVFALPVLRTDSGVRLLIDGNHHAVAQVKSRREPRIILVEAHAPLSAYLLPDLLREHIENSPMPSGIVLVELLRSRSRRLGRSCICPVQLMVHAVRQVKNC